MMRLGGKVREPFTPRDGRAFRRVQVVEVLCWWCRERHSPEEVETCMALPRKPSANGSSASYTSSALDAGPLKQYSELWAFLTQTTFEDGTKRKTGRLSLSFDVDMLALSLTDEETGQYACLNGRELETLLIDVEHRLRDQAMPWRASRYPRKGR